MSVPLAHTFEALELAVVNFASENTSVCSVTARTASTSSERRALPAFVLVKCLAVTVGLLQRWGQGAGNGWRRGWANARPRPTESKSARVISR